MLCQLEEVQPCNPSWICKAEPQRAEPRAVPDPECGQCQGQRVLFQFRRPPTLWVVCQMAALPRKPVAVGIQAACPAWWQICSERLSYHSGKRGGLHPHTRVSQEKKNSPHAWAQLSFQRRQRDAASPKEGGDCYLALK